MHQQLEHADRVRRQVAPRITQKRKAEFGQFMTPSGVARFMASLFPASYLRTCRLLDAGAGVGALSCAFLDRWVTGGFGFKSVEAFAYELDDTLREHLTRHLGSYKSVQPHIIAGDFIELATAAGLQGQGYTHAILNPPYKKINSRSPHRLALRTVGIETVNLYSAFVALAVALAAPGGQIVAIIPRSFCNGPYYRAFRDFVLERAAIRHIHLFESRSKAFKDDEVYRKTSSFALSVVANKALSRFQHRPTTAFQTLKPMNTSSKESCSRMTQSGLFMCRRWPKNPPNYPLSSVILWSILASRFRPVR